MADLEATMDTGGERLILARAFFQVALSHAAESSLRAVEMMAAAAGTASIFESSPLERRVQVIQAAFKHLAMAPNNLVVEGRVMLGLDPWTVRF